MTKFIVSYVIRGLLVVGAKDDREAKDKVGDFTRTVAGAVEAGLIAFPHEELP